ncbi:DUF4391 domain-containing protein [Vagococcus teuberi]|uniref:DUF4391 domain-containing protein n=1 Tax=Vagococcus teuberi TaxID=519472 RepID=A0A1J0A3W6_9ENTE|nr:DUF4391 domain-containing protein [Vagococcus teuberi]APB30622.1 hypothetical protein BHY08_01535 [Vagococcus teuberi]
MFDLPKKTQIKRNIYKKLIYEKFPKELSGNKKEIFDKEIKKITLINEISEQSINIRPTDNVSAIFLVLIELKTKDFTNANISLVSRLFGQKILVVLKYEDEYRLSIYETKLLLGDWKKKDEISLILQGLDLSNVWENLVTQVAKIEIEEGNSLEEQISLEARKEKLIKLIEKTEKQARKESQAKKKFELYKQLKEYKKELEEM